MVNQMDTNVVNEIDSLRETEAVTAATYRPEPRRSRKSRSKDILINDELILSLSDAYENERARQVSEWEYMRRQTVRHAT